DTLDDHALFWNFCRKVGLGALTRRRLIDAFSELAVQTAELRDFREGQSQHVDRWEAMVIAFESDRNAPNPFEAPQSGLSEADVTLQLATEDEVRAREGLLCQDELSPNGFVLALIDLENQQRTLRLAVAAKRYATTGQLSDLARQRTKIGRATARLREVQAKYLPAALQSLSRHQSQPTNGALPIEEQPLFPPSSLPSDERGLPAYNLGSVEARLRDAQCRTALEGMRDLLLVKSRMLTYKNNNARHQGATTRARALLKKNDEKINGFAQKYIDAHRALLRLANGDETRVRWPQLDPGRDIRCLDHPDDSRTRGHKRR
ncbi:hypothetical protein HDZ31DRAFT_24670, partial [Schizophyllum fasciatum]